MCRYWLELMSATTFLQPPPQSAMVLSSITFSWRTYTYRPQGMGVDGQPVVLNGKLYVKGERHTVLEYTPGHDQWAGLPPPPVEYLTIATLRGQLLVVGGVDKSTHKKTNTILTFDEHSRQWVQSYPAMPTALTNPAVMGYQDHLIVAGGQTASYIPDVNILNTASNQWISAQPLPSMGSYNITLIQDTVYLVGKYDKTVLQAHVPTLISGAKSGVWGTLPNTPYYCSSPINIGNTFLTVGGRDKPSRNGNPTTSIQMYDPTTNQWTRVGDLPEPIREPYCVIMNSELFVLGDYYSDHVHASELFTSFRF